jgi:DNA-binding LacI/PurR family transcriptional regulator
MAVVGAEEIGQEPRYSRAITGRSTIVDVAQLARVAVGTASDALNGKGRVSADTRARVVSAAEDLNFRPHRTARGLRQARTMSIGVRFGHERAVPAGHFFVDLLAGAAEAAAERGYAVTIMPPALSTDGMVDGLVVVDPVRVADARVAPGATPLPLVTVGRLISRGGPMAPWVDVDHRAVANDLLEHLDSQAVSGPAWMISLPTRYPFVCELETAFTRWTRLRGRAAQILCVPDEPHLVADAIRAELATEGTLPALVFTALDRQAVGARVALGGADIPIGCASDSDLLGVLDPPIAAVALDGRAHGRCAVSMTIDWIATGEEPAARQLPAALVSRVSA